MLNELLQDEIFVANSVTVVLDGVVHTDDRAALKSTTKQLKLEDKVDGKVFNSFSENLLFLLTCLKAGQDRQRLIFIIENFELFCAHHNQALLYNLFDVAQSAQTPVCILGITSRLDIVELLEKRVKSRFSHRQIFLRPDTANFDVLVLKSLLRLPSQKVKEILTLNQSLIVCLLGIRLSMFRSTKSPIKCSTTVQLALSSYKLHSEEIQPEIQTNRLLEQVH